MSAKPDVLVCNIEVCGQEIKGASLCDVRELHFNFDIVVPVCHNGWFLFNVLVCSRSVFFPFCSAACSFRVREVVITPPSKDNGQLFTQSEGLRTFFLPLAAYGDAVGKRRT